MAFDTLVLRSGGAGTFDVSLTDAVGTTGQIKVWTGAAWEAKPMKVWTGAAWVTKPVKFWDGASWVITPY
jgi:hypothetical protein